MPGLAAGRRRLPELADDERARLRAELAVYSEAHQRVIRAKRADLYSAPVGQSVGALTAETTVADVMYRLQLEYGEAVERLEGLP